MTRTIMFVLAAAVATSCGDPGAPTAQFRPLLEIVAGDAQVDTVAKELPTAITAQVLDSITRLPRAGILVNWVVAQGGGSVFAGAAITNDSGLARERWTLGTTAGPQRLEARAVDANTGQPIVYAQVTATAIAGPPAYVGWPARDWVITADSQVNLSASAADIYGNVVTAPAVVGLDSAYAQPSATGIWATSIPGYARFVVTWSGGADTLGVSIVPPPGPYALTWTDGLGVVYTESGILVRPTGVAVVDTTRPTNSACTLQGTVRYARTGMVATRSDSLADTARYAGDPSSGNPPAYFQICVYPGYVNGLLLTPVRGAQGWRSDYWAVKSATAGRWVYDWSGVANDSLVLTKP